MQIITVCYKGINRRLQREGGWIGLTAKGQCVVSLPYMHTCGRY